VKKRLIWLTAAAVIIAVAVLASVFYFSTGTVLEFQVRDSIAKSWVWDMEASIQNRVLHGYFQSDAGLITYRFTNLKPGSSVLTVSAPHYRSVEVPVDLKRGTNRLIDPIELTALDIPELADFYAFEKATAEGWDITLRPITSDLMAVMMHPVLDIWVGARVYDWNPALNQTAEELAKRPVVYLGPLEWRWDSIPESQFRYIATLPFSKLRNQTGSSYVFEYLILVPDPDKIDSAEYEKIIKTIESLDHDQIDDYIETLRGSVSLHTDISWNVGRSK